MSSIEGQIMSGDFDDEMNVFSLKKIKQFQTQTSLKENQLKALQHYLRQHEHDEDGQIITLYDQMLVPLSQDDIKALLDDLTKVQSLYH
ncbi:hypothetical protein ACG2QI_02260 [Bacillus sp. GM2]|jgi:hypothetical protein|uniref:Uncharacterized protein n=2 Tax=Bacillus licheniformis TaxID=1402 RepID=Q65FC8_BACLD|nr:MULTISPECIES: hypothetical protein [Bacillus]MBJ7885753.1 hypothetical protein [Bacillaceae bacterium HSR45]MBY8347830.1 hypothetical protein [Bacillus sp. PCH94]MDP4079830.1 hypothetical protein [Bacillota bacterium]AAU24867.1 hypothetical protein BL02132 [Bacillus licheniformis DSM 13 = ATCC 14580]AAU42236.1 hypothetical protein BLi03408 [Bacillus licheniformis DSM 13 = ATCC 14580]